MERDDGMDERFTRRGFIVAGGALAAGSAFAEGEGAASTNAPVPTPKPMLPDDPILGTGDVPLMVGAPCLQAPGETTMGVSWAVSGLLLIVRSPRR